MKDLKILDMLFKLADDQPRVAAVKMSAAIVLKRDFVAFGFNQYKSHPFQKRFSNAEDKIFLHAEMDAISRAVRRLHYKDLAQATLYVCRLKYDNCDHHCKEPRWGLAKPCVGCQRAIAQFGIKKVLYSTEGIGNFERL